MTASQNQIGHPDVPEWLRQLYEHVDSHAIEVHSDMFSTDVEVRVDNLPPISGREAIAIAYASSTPGRSSYHRIRHAQEVRSITIAELDVLHVNQDERVANTSCIAMFERHNNVITRVCIYTKGPSAFG
jgi:hypothetical protein